MIAASSAAVFSDWFFRLYQHTPIDLSKLTKTAQPTVVYDTTGAKYMKIGPTLTDLQYHQIPKNLQNAIVATEDNNYWNGSSVDVRSIFRSFLVDLLHRSADQGASTIQDQLAKMVYLNDDKTISYKLKQIILGIKINRAFTKQEILTMYLNKVFLGENSDGVDQAAMRYFGVNLKVPSETLTLDQAALLAGLPQAPTEYDPLAHPQAALERRNQVLLNMVKYGYISTQVATIAEKAPLGVKYHAFPDESWDKYPLFTNFLFDYAARIGITSEQLLHGGLKIYTTINPRVQKAVDTIFWSKNYDHDFPGQPSGTVVQGAAVFLDPKTGGILGAAGSRKQGFTQLGLDRAYTNSSPGSSIKPIMEYAPAIQSGKWKPSSILDNSPQDFGGGYIPQNWDANAPAKVTLQYGLEWSQNVASVWLLDKIGIATGTSFAMKDGIALTKNDREHLGVAIGGMQYGVNPLEMAQAYEPFDDNGVQMKSHLITRVVNQSGKTVYQFHSSSKAIMKPTTATNMTRLMEDVVDYGTGTVAKVPGWGVAGKTGTVQYSPGLTGESNWVRNAWFDGYTPNIVGSVYIGYDKSSPQYHLTMSPLDPSANAAKIFKDIVQIAESGVKPEKFDVGPYPASQGVATAAYKKSQATHPTKRRRPRIKSLKRHTPPRGHKHPSHHRK